MKKKQVEELISKVTDIEKLAELFFQKIQVKYSPSGSSGVIVLGFSDYSWVEPNGEILKIQLDLIDKYEDWYSQANQIISSFIPDRRPDFVDLYEKNKDIIELKEQIWSQDTSKFKNNFLRNIGKQKSMLSSTISIIGVNSDDKQNETNISTQYSNMNNRVDMSFYIDLKSQMTILSQQYSRIESDIKDLAQKIEGIGRITINNLNQNTAKTGNISISNENIIKWVKPDLDEELKQLKNELKTKNIEKSDKKIIDDIIDTILKEKHPKIDWLKDKVSKLMYWGTKAGIVLHKLKEFADALGIS
ncbi:hypothetical protein Lupro_02760 [Lutibacter profundi]|uniref:Uncharacterized protein n=1 Tax=Lutibacter profundi TaxID=1622118 RepID=A0A109RN32_9FLAO|nr:hypothetical protein [Lutibacter profundi]AMC10237.1 hypothetical protein Lupro_02760 [Lutibacter profundi]